MLKYAVQLSTDEVTERHPVVLRGTIDDCMERASKFGYDGVELFMHSPEEKDANHYKELSKKLNLPFTCICTGMEYGKFGLCLTSDDANIRKAAVEKLKHHVDFGKEIGAMICIGTMRGQIPDSSHRQESYKRLHEALIELNEYAKTKDVQLLVEDNPQYVSNFLNTVQEVGEFVRKINLSNVALHLDTHCMAMEDADIIGGIKEYKDILKYIHYSDSNRGYPGSCKVDFKAITKALLSIGYDGWITSECQPYPSQDECAIRGLKYMKAVEEAAKIELLQLKDSLYK